MSRLYNVHVRLSRVYFSKFIHIFQNANSCFFCFFFCGPVLFFICVFVCVCIRACVCVYVCEHVILSPGGQCERGTMGGDYMILLERGGARANHDV